MIHICHDEGERIGRPPIVRETLLTKLREMNRATIERLCEETGMCVGSARAAMRRAYQMGEVTRVRMMNDRRRYYVYEVKDE